MIDSVSPIRFDWTRPEIDALFQRPLLDLVYDAATVHRQYFVAGEVQLSTLLSIKTGACPEDCKYCPQSGHYHTELVREPLLDLDTVEREATAAKALGATRFCMGAAWKNPPAKDFPKVLAMVQTVKALGMESCMTLGMLTSEQADALADAGLDYYNHNLDTSPEFYGEIITTRTYQDRLETLGAVRDAGMKVCCGGILGMGETVSDRAGLIWQLATQNPHPESVPINLLVAVPGTPLADLAQIDPLDMVRAVAITRLTMPSSYVRLSAGREDMDEGIQALCFMAGANSIFYGERLLTTENPSVARDRALLGKLGLSSEVLTSA
ncbi:MAG: biotin synthase BioB [Litorivicinaceae bacterium]|jgi:biotin synthase|nr:biotin synthase BioB [Litorivicinaceae bacterium]MDP5328448.1 biotin synthase BioB [Litorivicinaceae bacterium]MDP5341748.1 biotin synthase BioB [Litorivicinaceae bacterium]